MLNEPSAVALAFGFGKGLARKRVLICLAAERSLLENRELELAFA